MTKKTARIKVVADGKVQYVDVDVTVDDPPRTTSAPPSGTSSATPTPAIPTSARKSPLGCLLVPVLIIGAVSCFGILFSANSSARQNNDRSTAVAITEDYNAQMAAAAATQSVQATTVASSVQSTQAADQALSAVSVSVQKIDCRNPKWSSGYFPQCGDYRITVQNGEIASWQWFTFYLQSGKTIQAPCDISSLGALCYVNEYANIWSDPAVKVCFDIRYENMMGTGYERTRTCKDIAG